MITNQVKKISTIPLPHLF